MMSNHIRGKRRAAFWRKTGFANLVLARAKLADNRRLAIVTYTEEQLDQMNCMHSLFDLRYPNDDDTSKPGGSVVGSSEEKRG
jgi:hypothetical protein